MERNIGIYRRYGFVETGRRRTRTAPGWMLVDMEKNLGRAEDRRISLGAMRYLPHTDQDRADMLATIGVGSIDELFSDIPPAKRLKQPLDLPKHKSELEVVAHHARPRAEEPRGAATGRSSSAPAPTAIAVPAAVDHIIQRSEFLTSYTPYQPEIAQGTLQYLFEFQTQVANLTGMEVANASMYDGSTATAEAVLMAHRVTRRKKAVLSGGLHPHYRETVETVSRMAGRHDRRARRPTRAARRTSSLRSTARPPASSCSRRPSTASSSTCSRSPRRRMRIGALLVAVFTEVVSLGLLEPPGAQGADIVVGEGQGIGNALNFGGPYVGLFATRQKFIRQMPGRLSGMTVDAEGKRGFVLTLSTREQHIRREKATSNICTNSGLCSLAFTAHMTLLGETGLRQLAEANHARACQLADALSKVPGVEVLNESVLQRVHGEAAEGRRRRWSRRWRSRASWPACRCRGSCRTSRSSRTCSSSRRRRR